MDSARCLMVHFAGFDPRESRNLSPADLLHTLAAALLIGVVIGAVGVGGVLLGPWLTQVIGLPVHVAVAIMMLAFVPPGVVALASAMRSMQATERTRWWLVAATAPGALAGAAALSLVPEKAAIAVLATVMCAAGLRLLSGGMTTRTRSARAPRPRVDAASGLVVGFSSAVTGTGGPMVLTPLALWAGLPLREVIALGLLVQLPIATTASIAHLLTRDVDIVAGLSVGAMLVPGVIVGQRLGRRLPIRLLAKAVGLVLLAAGIAFALEAF